MRKCEANSEPASGLSKWESKDWWKCFCWIENLGLDLTNLFVVFSSETQITPDMWRCGVEDARLIGSMFRSNGAKDQHNRFHQIIASPEGVPPTMDFWGSFFWCPALWRNHVFQFQIFRIFREQPPFECATVVYQQHHESNFMHHAWCLCWKYQAHDQSFLRWLCLFLSFFFAYSWPFHFTSGANHGNKKHQNSRDTLTSYQLPNDVILCSTQPRARDLTLSACLADFASGIWDLGCNVPMVSTCLHCFMSSLKMWENGYGPTAKMGCRDQTWSRKSSSIQLNIGKAASFVV